MWLLLWKTPPPSPTTTTDAPMDLSWWLAPSGGPLRWFMTLGGQPATGQGWVSPAGGGGFSHYIVVVGGAQLSQTGFFRCFWAKLGFFMFFFLLAGRVFFFFFFFPQMGWSLFEGCWQQTCYYCCCSGQLHIPSHIRTLHVEQEVVGDDTSALQSVLECDTKRENLLLEEREISAKLNASRWRGSFPILLSLCW